MAKVNKDVIIKVATYAAGAGLTYFLIVKPILTKLGLVKSAAQLAAEQAGINYQYITQVDLVILIQLQKQLLNH